jgi:hypothetical protein
MSGIGIGFFYLMDFVFINFLDEFIFSWDYFVVLKSIEICEGIYKRIPGVSIFNKNFNKKYQASPFTSQHFSQSIVS